MCSTADFFRSELNSTELNHLSARNATHGGIMSLSIFIHVEGRRESERENIEGQNLLKIPFVLAR